MKVADADRQPQAGTDARGAIGQRTAQHRTNALAAAMTLAHVRGPACELARSEATFKMAMDEFQTLR